MRWVARGVSKKTGKDDWMEVDGESEAEARVKASQYGLLIENIDKVHSPINTIAPGDPLRTPYNGSLNWGQALTLLSGLVMACALVVFVMSFSGSADATIEEKVNAATTRVIAASTFISAVGTMTAGVIVLLLREIAINTRRS